MAPKDHSHKARTCPTGGGEARTSLYYWTMLISGSPMLEGRAVSAGRRDLNKREAKSCLLRIARGQHKSGSAGLLMSRPRLKPRSMLRHTPEKGKPRFISGGWRLKRSARVWEQMSGVQL